jgi:hypothetical protein
LTMYVFVSQKLETERWREAESRGGVGGVGVGGDLQAKSQGLRGGNPDVGVLGAQELQ